MPRMNRKPGEKVKDFKGTLKKLIKYAGRYRIGIIAVMICAIASATFSIVSPKILGKATTKLAEGLMSKISGTGSIDFGYIGKILIIVLVLYGISSLFNLVQGFTMSTITQKLCYRLRREIVEKINRMPMKYFESRTYGEVLSRITNDVDTLGNGLNQSVTQLITSLTTMMGVVIMMLTISPLMTLITLLILPVSMIFISFIMKHSQKYFKTQQEYLGHINGQVEENYGGHLVVKAFGKEQDVINEFKKTNNVLYNSAWKSQFFSSIMQPMMQFIGNLGYVVVCILGGYLAVKSVVDIGDIQAFIQYMRNFTSPILKFNAYVGKYVESGEILGRVDGGPYIKSPSNGKFIEVDAERGDYVLTTDVMGYVANTYDMYIGANIEETDITKIKEGQSVKVTLDAYGSQKFEGIVTQVNSITNNALTGQTTSFSTSGTYTKTTQLIPIKIKLVNSDIPLENIIGTNATVNIKVK